jgi:hypothetical protein
LAAFLGLNEMMRPEYESAVNAVRFGWSLWIVFIIPALMIWMTLLQPSSMSLGKKIAAGCIVFAIAVVTFWCLTLYQGHRLQSTKVRLAKTWREGVDVDSDTWRVMAPIVAIPYGVVYCGGHLLGVIATALVWRGVAYLLRRKRIAKDRHETSPNDLSEIDANPYAAPLVPSHPVPEP